MACAEGVIDAFGTFRESADALLCSVLTKCFSSTCDDFVGIGLVADIKYYLVLRSVIYIMQSDYQFHSSKAWSKVARVDGAAFYHIMTHLLAKSLELLYGEFLDVCRGVDFVQKCICCFCHCEYAFGFAKVLKNAIFANCLKNIEIMVWLGATICPDRVA